MTPLFLFLALIIQGSVTFANDEDIPTRDDLLPAPEFDDFQDSSADWMNLFGGGGFSPKSYMAEITTITNSDQTSEEQIEALKKMTEIIKDELNKQMISVLSLVMENSEDKVEENGMRKKRSVETPMDSTQLVMRLLKHIKANNEHQNIAIEKMMSAQEIAEKYGIEFNPDPEILSDLALSANEHAKEVADLLKETINVRNFTEEVQFVPLDEECPVDNDTYYTYAVHPDVTEDFSPFAPYEYAPEPIYYPEHHHQMHQSHHYPHVTPKPSYYDSMMGFTPVPEFYIPYFEPVTTTTTIIFPIEEIVEPEPELVGEEYEETVSSKVFVEHEQGGSATVNHVTTYTLSEKAHFKTPEIEKLPQQMQYTFFLM